MTVSHHRHECSESNKACRTLRSDSRLLGIVDQDNLPFMLCPPGAETAALLIHGFTATPWEMRSLAEFLADTGIASLAVRLPGHGTTPEDLAGRRWEEWRDSVIIGHQILSKEFKSVFGMGMSTGCLLLLATAATHQFNGLVLFSPYLRVLHKLAPLAGWLRWIRPYHEKHNGDKVQGRYYSRRPVAGVHQINRLAQKVRKELPQRHCPVLAFNGEGDETVDLKSSRELMRRMGSKVKIHEIFGPEVPHVLTREDNPRRWSMFAQATQFVHEINALDSTIVVR